MITNCQLKTIFIGLIAVLIQEINCFKCGANKLNIKPGMVNITEEESKRRLSNEYTNIKIKLDYSSCTKPSQMDNKIFSEIKSLIQETVDEIQKFLKVQHVNIDLSINGKAQIKEFCNLNNLNDGYQNHLINNDLVIFPGFDIDLDEGTIAAAGPCMETSDHKPCVGVLYINNNILSMSKKNSNIYYKTVLLHEITHILIFHPIILLNLNMLTADKEAGIIYVSSKRVLDKARNHFKCTTLKGLPLEDQGGEGTAGYHWEGRYMLGDYMIGTDYSDSFISDITLALFEDTAFYQVDYNYGVLFKFGKNKGCDFFNKKCIENGELPFEDEFCMYTGTPMCTQSRTFKSECKVYDYSIYNLTLPERYQYFENPTHGGAFYADFCPIPEPLSSEDYYNLDDYYPNSCSVGTSNLPDEYGEKIGSHSFCFISSLLPSSSSYSVESRAICYEIECDKNNNKIILKIGNNKFECPTEGGMLTPSGYKGQISCPKYSDICNFMDDKVCNEIFECLKKEEENNSLIIKTNIYFIFAYLLLYIYIGI